MYKHVLFPVDLSDKDSWQKTLPTALDMCRTYGGSLHVLSVLPDFGMSIVGQYFPDGYEKDVASKALEHLHTFVKEHVPEDVRVQHVVGEGNVYEVILKIAGEINADVIVMGSHRPKLEDYLLGPNSARVVRHAKCSVFIVRA